MSDAPLTTAQREAIRRHARAMAVRMGYATEQQPDPAATPPAVQLPTENVFALRGLLSTGRLVGEQAAAARSFLASASAPLADPPAASPNHTPEDAA